MDSVWNCSVFENRSIFLKHLVYKCMQTDNNSSGKAWEHAAWDKETRCRAQLNSNSGWQPACTVHIKIFWITSVRLELVLTSSQVQGNTKDLFIQWFHSIKISFNVINTSKPAELTFYTEADLKRTNYLFLTCLFYFLTPLSWTVILQDFTC